MPKRYGNCEPRLGQRLGRLGGCRFFSERAQISQLSIVLFYKCEKRGDVLLREDVALLVTLSRGKLKIFLRAAQTFVLSAVLVSREGRERPKFDLWQVWIYE